MPYLDKGLSASDRDAGEGSLARVDPVVTQKVALAGERLVAARVWARVGYIVIACERCSRLVRVWSGQLAVEVRVPRLRDRTIGGSRCPGVRARPRCDCVVERCGGGPVVVGILDLSSIDAVGGQIQLAEPVVPAKVVVVVTHGPSGPSRTAPSDELGRPTEETLHNPLEAAVAVLHQGRVDRG